MGLTLCSCASQKGRFPELGSRSSDFGVFMSFEGALCNFLCQLVILPTQNYNNRKCLQM